MKREPAAKPGEGKAGARYLERKAPGARPLGPGDRHHFGRKTAGIKARKTFIARAIRETGKIGMAAGRKRYRSAYSESENEAFSKFKKLMEDIGLHTEVDIAGNLYGILSGKGNGIVLTGSHLDGVKNGGLYDGVAGVACSLEAVRAISRLGLKTSNDLVVVAWRAEESVRFGIPYIGSKAAFGKLKKGDLKRTDETGKTLLKAMHDEAKLKYSERSLGALLLFEPQDIRNYVELHAEQGRKLAGRGFPIGAVNSIAGNHRFSIVLKGQPDHTGGCRMEDRMDAMRYAIELGGFIYSLPTKHPQDDLNHMTTTVLDVPNQERNNTTVPHLVRMDVEIRCNRMAELHAAFGQVEKRAEAGGFAIENHRHSEPIELDNMPKNEYAREKILRACDALGVSPLHLPSGAGHDAATLASSGVPTAMIFVPSEGGWAHHPKEFTRPEHLTLGAEVLAEALMQMDEE